jgi:hypothetical protein
MASHQQRLVEQWVGAERVGFERTLLVCNLVCKGQTPLPSSHMPEDPLNSKRRWALGRGWRIAAFAPETCALGRFPPGAGRLAESGASTQITPPGPAIGAVVEARARTLAQREASRCRKVDLPSL